MDLGIFENDRQGFKDTYFAKLELGNVLVNRTHEGGLMAMTSRAAHSCGMATFHIPRENEQMRHACDALHGLEHDHRWTGDGNRLCFLFGTCGGTCNASCGLLVRGSMDYARLPIGRELLHARAPSHLLFDPR
eukprot:scaffold576_cov336-Pavlova_lutheri.AAC.1